MNEFEIDIKFDFTDAVKVTNSIITGEIRAIEPEVLSRSPFKYRLMIAGDNLTGAACDVLWAAILEEAEMASKELKSADRDNYDAMRIYALATAKSILLADVALVEEKGETNE